MNSERSDNDTQLDQQRCWVGSDQDPVLSASLFHIH